MIFLFCKVKGANLRKRKDAKLGVYDEIISIMIVRLHKPDIGLCSLFCHRDIGIVAVKLRCYVFTNEKGGKK